MTLLLRGYTCIHNNILLMQEDLDINFYPGAFLFLFGYTTKQQLSCVHKTGKYYIVLFRNVSDFRAVCGLKHLGKVDFTVLKYLGSCQDVDF